MFPGDCTCRGLKPWGRRQAARPLCGSSPTGQGPTEACAALPLLSSRPCCPEGAAQPRCTTAPSVPPSTSSCSTAWTPWGKVSKAPTPAVLPCLLLPSCSCRSSGTCRGERQRARGGRREPTGKRVGRETSDSLGDREATRRDSPRGPRGTPTLRSAGFCIVLLPCLSVPPCETKGFACSQATSAMCPALVCAGPAPRPTGHLQPGGLPQAASQGCDQGTPPPGPAAQELGVAPFSAL